jgi:hypothetical protein
VSYIPATTYALFPTLTPTAILVLLCLYQPEQPKPMKLGSLGDYANRSEDQISRACKELEALGVLDRMDARTVALKNARTVARMDARTDARKNADFQEPPDQAKTPSRPQKPQPKQLLRSSGSDGNSKTPVCVTPTQERTFNKDQQQVQEHTHKTNLELICDELAFAWQGTTDLTEVAASKLTKPGLDLERAGFSASDVVSIAKFIRARDSWRKGPITPVILATEAPSWRASGGVVPSAAPRRGHVATDEQWASEEAEYEAQIEREIAKAEAADAERERVK